MTYIVYECEDTPQSFGMSLCLSELGGGQGGQQRIKPLGNRGVNYIVQVLRHYDIVDQKHLWSTGEHAFQAPVELFRARPAGTTLIEAQGVEAFIEQIRNQLVGRTYELGSDPLAFYGHEQTEPCFAMRARGLFASLPSVKSYLSRTKRFLTSLLCSVVLFSASVEREATIEAVVRVASAAKRSLMTILQRLVDFIVAECMAKIDKLIIFFRIGDLTSFDAPFASAKSIGRRTHVRD